MSATILVYFCIGLVLLIIGAELLVGGASRIAARLGLSPIATLDHRDFRVVRPAHTEAFELLP